MLRLIAVPIGCSAHVRAVKCGESSQRRQHMLSVELIVMCHLGGYASIFTTDASLEQCQHWQNHVRTIWGAAYLRHSSSDPFDAH